MVSDVPTADLMVLAVDDHDGVLCGLRCALGARFACFDTASSGTKALRSLESEHYDAVLVDVMMPEMDGITCCKRMRERHPELVIIMLSAYDDADYKRDAFVAGADDYLLKPISAEELYTHIAIHASARRRKAAALGTEAPSAPRSPNMIEIAELRVDLLSKTVCTAKSASSRLPSSSCSRSLPSTAAVSC